MRDITAIHERPVTVQYSRNARLVETTDQDQRRGTVARTPTVLIVDDDPAIRKMLVEMLSLEGYPTETAANGAEALTMLTRGAPRVVLLDLSMPVLDGRGVMAGLEAEAGAREKHRVILISAWVTLEAANDLDVDGKLPKPFTVAQLMSVLEPLAGGLS